MIVFLGGCSNAPRRRGLFFGDQRLRSHVRTQDPLRRGRRRSMGGRGQGEDRRRARRARRPRRALSGRRERGPHGPHHRRRVRAAPDPLGYPAGRGVHRGERRRVGSRDALHRARRPHVTRHPHRAQAVRVGARPPHAPLPQAARPGPRATRKDRHDGAGHRPDLRGQVRPPRDSRGRPPQPRAGEGARLRTRRGRERLPRAARLRRAGGRGRAQGALLDVDHGTYPYVTSSNTTAGGAAVGAGIGPTAIDAVVGVVKAYTTRVGNGPLPTEAEPALAERIRELGDEFGATTGRPRRCGWFDAVVVRYAVRVNGLTGLAVTKLDVLDTFAEIPVCVGYRLDGEALDSMPAEVERLGRVEPVYESLPGWQRSLSLVRRLADLPPAARAYLDRLQDLAHAPIQYVSVGTHRDQIIEVT